MLAEGVTVRALPGAFRDPNDCLFTARGVTNATLRGEPGRPGSVRAAADATCASLPMLRMARDDYADRSEYRFSEWRHTLSLIDCANVRVSDLAFSHSGGDGIYVGHGCTGIDIRRVECRDHWRQGISVISARNLTIADSRFIDTRGTPPQCGIDFEPNRPDEELSNCLVENCDFDCNAASGIFLHLPNLDETSAPVSIAFKNCRARGNGAMGLGMTVGASGRRKPVGGEI
ncbi:MAG: right-handed parallel beta-helix repeat-containing protein, partial [Kiritimatiellae bacterium]|nr:right-handed parallel beta-helix repeat-containing protein [Kiritimatiellia bacterium]